MDVGVGRNAFGELDGGDPERPDVRFEAVARFFDDFGGHPEGSADDRFALGVRVVQLGGDAEVRELRNALFGEQNVPGLYVLA